MRFRIAALCLLGWIVSISLLHAHPIHTSYAEVDYRAGPERLEVAIRVFTDDMEAVLSKQTGHKITVATTPRAELDALLLAYVRERFAVKTRAGAAQTLTWVGRELKDGDQQLWIYVECPLAGGVTGARFSHRLLREAFSDQINSVVVRDHGSTPVRAVTLLFTDAKEQVVAAK